MLADDGRLLVSRERLQSVTGNDEPVAVLQGRGPKRELPKPYGSSDQGRAQRAPLWAAACFLRGDDVGFGMLVEECAKRVVGIQASQFPVPEKQKHRVADTDPTQ